MIGGNYMAILNRLSVEELNDRLTPVNTFTDEPTGLKVYKYTDKINFSVENIIFASIKFVINYEVFKHDFNDCAIINVRSEFYIDEQCIETDTIYHSSIESIELNDINLNKVYDEIDCMFIEIRHLLRLKKKRYNIGHSALLCAASIYRYELLCNWRDYRQFYS